jgi:hypothetical protein
MDVSDMGTEMMWMGGVLAESSGVLSLVSVEIEVM